MTLGAGALLLAGLRLPVSQFLSSSVVGPGASPPDDLVGQVTLLQFGVEPFLATFVLVELVALLVPALRPRRVGSAAARAPLFWSAMGLGTLAMASRIVTLLQWVRASDLGGLFPAPPMLAAQLGLAAVAMLALLFISTRHGLLDGFALMALVEAVSLGATQLGRLRRGVELETLTPAAVVLHVGVLSAAVAFAVWRARRSLPTAAGPEQLTVPSPASGLDPWILGASLLTLPATFASLLGRQASGVSVTDTALGFGLNAFLGLDAALILGFLFFRPKAVGALWARWVKGVDEAGVVLAARARLPRVLAEAAALAVGAPLVVSVVLTSLRLPSGGWLTVQAMAAALVGLDATREWRARRRLGALVSVRPVHRLAELQPLLHLLAREGIEAFPRSVAYRATLQFFGPQVPIELLVPAAQADAARQVLDGR